MLKRPTALLTIFVLLAVSSCTLQRRQYMPGFYLHWKEKTNKITYKTGSSRDKNVTIAEIPQADTVGSIVEPFLASAGKEPLVIPSSKSFTEGNEDDCGDSLFLRSGTKSRVRILEVTENEVIFKRCANLNGPELTINKNDVQKIRYQSGNVETFKEVKKNDLKKIVKGEAKFAKDTQASVCLFLALLFLLAVALFLIGTLVALELLYWIGWVSGLALFFITLLLSAYTLYKIKQEPDKYSGKRKARLALFIIFIGLAIILPLVVMFIWLVIL